MILKNWYKLLSYTVFGKGMGVTVGMNGGTSTVSQANIPLVSNSQSGISGGYWGVMDKISTSSTKVGTAFGTGDTAPTIDDYCFSGEQITSITGTVSSPGVTLDDNGVTATATYTLTNSGTTEVTIKEIGLITNYHGGSGTSGASMVLIERTVLDEPVTIEGGGVGQVTYTIRMNYPTA